jgi:hypothetical protein
VRVSGQSSAAEPRDASTVILARDGQPAGRTTSEPEVLLLRRHRDSGFAASAWVLPGSRVDARDAELDAALWQRLDPQRLAPSFGRTAEAWLAAQGLCLDLGALTYWSRWITPLGEHKRYDTRFFVARYEDELA